MTEEALVGLPDAHVDPGGPGLLLDEPDGPSGAPDPIDLGPATVDSDADGHADTTVIDAPGRLVLATDLDGDARVDVVTTIAADGTAATREIPVTWGAWDEGVPPPAPTIDPATGHWIRGG